MRSCVASHAVADFERLGDGEASLDLAIESDFRRFVASDDALPVVEAVLAVRGDTS